MVQIVLKKRETEENEFFFSYNASLNKGNLNELFRYINSVSNINIQWIDRIEMTDIQSHSALGIRIIIKEGDF